MLLRRGDEEALPGGGDHDPEADQAAEERRELGPEQPGREHVGRGHRQRCEEREFPDPETLAEAPVGAEEAGHRGHHDERDQRSRDGVEHRDPEADEGHEVGPFGKAEAGRVGGHRLRSREPGGDPDQDRGSGGAERDGGALDQHARDHRGERREPESHQEGHRDRRGSAETGRALDEGPEQPGDHEDLNAPVRGDPHEAAPDHRERAALLQRVQEQDGAEDDVEEGRRHH